MALQTAPQPGKMAGDSHLGVLQKVREDHALSSLGLCLWDTPVFPLALQGVSGEHLRAFTGVLLSPKFHWQDWQHPIPKLAFLPCQ